MISPPPTGIPIVKEDGTMEQQFRLFTDDVSKLSPFIGTGSPEGVVDSEQWREYIDESGVAGSIKYIKKLADIGGDTKKGWILI